MRLWDSIQFAGLWRIFLSLSSFRLAVFRTMILGHDGELGEFRGSDADPLKTFRHDAVRSGQQANEQIHRSDSVALVLTGPVVGVAQQTEDVVGKEFAIENQNALGLAFLLVEQLLKLAQQLGEISA